MNMKNRQDLIAKVTERFPLPWRAGEGICTGGDCRIHDADGVQIGIFSGGAPGIYEKPDAFDIVDFIVAAVNGSKATEESLEAGNAALPVTVDESVPDNTAAFGHFKQGAKGMEIDLLNPAGIVIIRNIGE